MCSHFRHSLISGSIFMRMTQKGHNKVTLCGTFPMAVVSLNVVTTLLTPFTRNIIFYPLPWAEVHTWCPISWKARLLQVINGVGPPGGAFPIQVPTCCQSIDCLLTSLNVSVTFKLPCLPFLCWNSFYDRNNVPKCRGNHEFWCGPCSTKHHS